MKWAEQDAQAVSSRLRLYLAQLGRWFPQIWSRVDDFRAARGKDLPNWPNWCFLPIAGAYSIYTQGRDFEDIDPVARKALWVVVPEIAALASWRPTQGIYRFHPETFSALWDTPVEGDIPVELLYRLPEWCCYIDCYGTQLGAKPLAGCFVHLEWDAKTGRHELRLLLDSGDQNGIFPMIMHISGRKTMAEMFAGFVAESERVAETRGLELPEDFAAAKEEVSQVFSKMARPLMSLILYLCSSTPEFQDARGTDKLPARVKPTKTKRGERIFPPDRPTIWETGYRIGSLIEQARRTRSGGTGETTHASPEPHIRKPHWHSFWKGPQDDPKKRELIAHWLPPIPVGYKPGEKIVPTIHPVR
ncbi:MAG: hypothetical protein M1398_03430 [Deltaproteobacteria bacterium]|nr:hypothetical protein [Deltaproteobacteria bacterium]